MNKLKTLAVVAVILFVSSFVIYETIHWKIKNDYTVRVYQGGSHFVSFKGLKADISFDEENPEKSKISASLVADSIDCGRNLAMKDGALKPEALDAKSFPLLSFKSTSVIKQDSTAMYFFRTVLFSTADPKNFKYRAIGDLTIKGVTKKIIIPFTFENKVFAGAFTIRPKDFNITSEMFQKDLMILLNLPVEK